MTELRFILPRVGEGRWSTLGRAAHVVLASIAKWEIRVRSRPKEQSREGPQGRADQFPTSRQKRARYGAPTVVAG